MLALRAGQLHRDGHEVQQATGTRADRVEDADGLYDCIYGDRRSMYIVFEHQSAARMNVI